ncbi:MAG: hsp70 family protein [Victivallales bacterium]|nr:hsp70 family protein [Victivallales bacterium]MCF7888495.1 hsp70 family protein [Victivallales bacterium]
MEYSKYIIGIDLGTTNSAVTYVDLEERNREAKVFKVPQLCEPGEVDTNELLPSFCFFPDRKIIPEKITELQWKPKLEYTVGIYARKHGSAMPNRFISSVKSWLCHAGVDRKKPILPWGSNIPELQKSPIEITSYYLAHIKNAWDYKFSKIKDIYGNKSFFANQQVIITVPASFDETARELTIEAAEIAGYKNIKLLEEPLAAFYSWLDKENENWKEYINPGDRVLVVDVGGGTCDFSIIKMDEKGVLSRTAAGNHLLLGGDNIDIAVARNIEKKWNKKLSHGEWLILCQNAREAKEKLLSRDIDSVEVVLLSQGSSVIGGSRKAVVRKNDLINLLNEGFIPEIDIKSNAPAQKKGLQTMGLPYASDAAITKHLLQFLRYSHQISEKIGSRSDSDREGVLFPEKILFNGGTMVPALMRDRIINIVNSWFPDKKITELHSRNLSLAVSYGASYYGRTRLGDGIKVKSGTALSYYLQIDERKGKEKLICIMPRGIEENIDQNSEKVFKLMANKKVRFPLYSSATRIGDRSGDIIPFDSEITFVSSMNTVLKYGRQNSGKEVKASIHSLLTETGVLKVYLKSLQSTHSWPLNFDTRLIGESLNDKKVNNEIVIDQGKIDTACKKIKIYFDSSNNSENIVKQIESTVELKKKEWPLQCLRKFADALITVPYETLRLPAKEAKWLNLTGYCLRPGFGDPEDGLRLKKIWGLWYKKMNNPKNAAVVSEWWIFWRRVVSGLNNGHHRTISQELVKKLCPKGKFMKNIKIGTQAKAEMWRCLGAVELILPQKKQEIAKALLEHVNKLESYEYWVLARLGNRRLFHAPVNNIVPSENVQKWLDKILNSKHSPKTLNEKLFAVSCMARLTDNRAVNVDEEHLNAVLDYLKKHKASVNWIEHLKAVRKDSVSEQGRIAGDSIPLGLTLEEK